MFDIRRWFAAPPFRKRPRDEAERAAVLIQAGEPQEALAALDAALTADAAPERRAFAHNKRGVALVELGRGEEALAAFCEALCVVENYAPALVNIGNLLLEDGDVTAAIEHYRAAIRADETYAGGYLNLGVALKRAGRANEAARCLKKALRLEMRRRS
jgi:tetratricopeptide (TPR) repeat protein